MFFCFMVVCFCIGLVDCSCGKGMLVFELFLLDKYFCFLIMFLLMEIYESNCIYMVFFVVYISGLLKYVLVVFLIFVLY